MTIIPNLDKPESNKVEKKIDEDRKIRLMERLMERDNSILSIPIQSFTIYTYHSISKLSLKIHTFLSSGRNIRI